MKCLSFYLFHASQKGDSRQSWNFFQPNSESHVTVRIPKTLNETSVESNLNEGTDSSSKPEDSEECTVSENSDSEMVKRKKKTPMCLINELARHHKVLELSKDKLTFLY